MSGMKFESHRAKDSFVDTSLKHLPCLIEWLLTHRRAEEREEEPGEVHPTETVLKCFIV